MGTTGRDVAECECEWILLEFVFIATLLGVGSVILGDPIRGLLCITDANSLGSAGTSLAVQAAAQSVNPPMAGLILAEVSVSWLHFRQGAGPTQYASVSMLRVHVCRVGRGGLLSRQPLNR